MKAFFKTTAKPLIKGGAVLLLLLLALLLAACGSAAGTVATDTVADTGDGTAEPVESTADTVAETTEPRPTVGNPSSLFYPSQEADSLPILSIDTGNIPVTSREEYVSASVSARGTLDDDLFGFEGLSGQVRCRGNYTYTGTAKKSYRLKFDEKINLFGQGAGSAKSWVLMAEHCDQSFLRNHLAFGIASKLSNISYVSSSSFVKLYLNGDYQGIYHLAEQHQVGEYRVNIQEDPAEVDTDYLIERDSYADEDGWEGVNWFRVDGTKYLVKSDNMTGEKCAFLEDYFYEVQDALRSGERIRVARYIDLASFIDTYLLQALTKNIDVGYSSFFMVKKAGGVLYFTCPWDFDLAFGNDKRLDNGAPEGLYVGAKSDLYQEHEWFYLLFNETWFCNMVRSRWNAVKADLLSVAEEIDRITAHFGDDMATNFEVWPFPRRSVNQEPAAILRLKSYPEHTAYLKTWFLARFDFLDALFNSEELYQQGGYEDWWHWW